MVSGDLFWTAWSLCFFVLVVWAFWLAVCCGLLLLGFLVCEVVVLFGC